jgi:hypothetical protein
LPNKTNRSFIEKALELAISNIASSPELQPATREGELALDKDTMNVPGSPPIAETIFNKISECSALVSDLTFIASTEEGRLIPNPNVLIEYGWALRSIGHRRIITIMNTAFGKPSAETLPFDLRHQRYPITYYLTPDDIPEARARELKKLSTLLEKALVLILAEPEEVLTETTQWVEQEIPTTSNTFFDGLETMIIPDRDGHDGEPDIFPPRDHLLFLRIIPSHPGLTLPSKKNLEDLITQAHLRPMGDGMRGWFNDRNRYGAMACYMENGVVINMVQLFSTGEIWGIDAHTIAQETVKKYSPDGHPFFATELMEKIFRTALTGYMKFAKNILNLPAPYKVIAGATDVKGYRIAWGKSLYGHAVDNNIVFEKVIPSWDITPDEILDPLLDHIWEECGLTRSQFR